jgi:Tfp pilus assembly protein PilN
MNRLVYLVAALGLTVSATSDAAVSDADIDELRAQLAALSQRIEQLAAENAELKQAQAETADAVAAQVVSAPAPAASGDHWSEDQRARRRRGQH